MLRSIGITYKSGSSNAHWLWEMAQAMFDSKITFADFITFEQKSDGRHSWSAVEQFHKFMGRKAIAV
jgi:hypothetical protein